MQSSRRAALDLVRLQVGVRFKNWLPDSREWKEVAFLSSGVREDHACAALPLALT